MIILLLFIYLLLKPVYFLLHPYAFILDFSALILFPLLAFLSLLSVCRHPSSLSFLYSPQFLTNLLEIFLDLIIPFFSLAGAIRYGIEVLLIIFSYVLFDDFLSVVDYLEVGWLLGGVGGRVEGLFVGEVVSLHLNLLLHPNYYKKLPQGIPHRYMIAVHYHLIQMGGYQRCTSANTSRWSQGCSFEGRQVLSSALSPLKQVIDPQPMLLVEMMRSLDSFTSSSALWYCACELVRFLRVVNSNSQRGQRWKALAKRQSVCRKEFRSPPTMIWYLGRYSFNLSRSFFRLSIWILFLSALELRCTQAKMKLSAPAKATLSAHRKFFCCSELISLEIQEKSCTLEKACLLRTMRESSLGSVTMYWLDFFSQLSKRAEYSWMKKTSGFRRWKPCMNFLNFSYSSRKLILQRGAILLRKMAPSCLMASSKGMLPNTYSSSEWYMMKSYNFTVSFSSFFHPNLKLPLLLSNSCSHFSSNSFLLSSVFQNTPTVPSNMWEQRPFLKVLSILPISHLKAFSSKPFTYLGMSLRKMEEMAAMSFSQSLKQNSKGLKAMPQQLRVATVMVSFRFWEALVGSLTVYRAVSKFPILFTFYQQDAISYHQYNTAMYTHMTSYYL